MTLRRGKSFSARFSLRKKKTERERRPSTASVPGDLSKYESFFYHILLALLMAFGVVVKETCRDDFRGAVSCW